MKSNDYLFNNLPEKIIWLLKYSELIIGNSSSGIIEFLKYHASTLAEDKTKDLDNNVIDVPIIKHNSLVNSFKKAISTKFN